MKPHKHINAETQELQEIRKAWASMQEEFNQLKMEAVRKDAYAQGVADTKAKYQASLKWFFSSVVAPIVVALVTVCATKFF